MIAHLVAVGLAAALVAAPTPQTRCDLTDDRLAELSGLAVDATGVWAIDDDGKRTEVRRIDPETCEVLDTRTARVDPRDTEDLAVGPDGALWVADTGDNERRRETVAVVVLPERGEPRLHRLTYPDGPHDAEALLVDAGGSPVIVTKDAGQPAGIYRTDGPPAGEEPTPLVRAGTLSLPQSATTGGPLGGLGSRLVTGAASTADRTVVAVRTYTDAWLFAVPGGDVVAALTSPEAGPVRIPLPDEPQGEAIAFLPDGTLLSGSESRDGAVGQLRAVPGAAALAATGGGDPGQVPASDLLEEAPPWLPAVAGVAVGGGVLLVLMLALARRRR